MDLFTALKEFDFENMLPDIGAYVFGLKLLAWVLLMVGPVVLLVLGTQYSKGPAFDPNCSWAYGHKWVSSDPAVWDKAHELAGKSWKTLGSILVALGAAAGIVFFLVNALVSAIITVLVIILELVLILISRSAINKTLNQM